MNQRDFMRFVRKEMKAGGVRFKVIRCRKEILLFWTNSKGRLCNVLLYQIKRVRPEQQDQIRLHRYRDWLSSILY